MSSRSEKLIIAALILALFHYAMTPLIILFISILISFFLDPIAGLIQKTRAPRPVAVLLAMMLCIAGLYWLVYLSYSQFSEMLHNLPNYSDKIRGFILHVREKVETIRDTTAKALPMEAGRKPVSVKPVSGWEDVFAPVSKISEIALYTSFIPFLVYFMLTWRDHAVNATVRLFKESERGNAYVALQDIGRMLRNFLIGNLLVGLFIGTCSLIVFGVLRLPHFYFIAYLSGFLSLVPYLGIVAAMLPPLATGLGQLHSGGLIAVLLAVIVLHLFALNVLYPKFLGRSLQLNPVASVIGLLFWSWIWGGAGLVLAIPIMGALKIICDHTNPLKAYGVWLGVRQAAPPQETSV